MSKTDWTSVRVTRTTLERLKNIAQRVNMTMDEVISKLLDAYEGTINQTQTAVEPQSTVGVAPPARVVEDLLYILEPVVTALLEIVRVYPDLRAEAGLVVGMAYDRFCEVARAWGLMETPPHETPEAGEGQVPA